MEHLFIGLLILFLVLDESLSPEGNYAFAILSGQKVYKILKGYAPVFFEINTSIDAGFIVIDGTVIELDFVLGWDYKFQLLLMGFNAANSNYAYVAVQEYKQINRTSKRFNILLHNQSVLESEIIDVELMVANWINDFISIALHGYAKHNVTPDRHMMASHVPTLLTLSGTLKPFSRQGKIRQPT
uniref:Uncharacterized protein n=1 Tax=Amphimedon queenslandica TaxID=400682 RepID=A0A1X7VJS1_AMPQE